MNSYMTPGGPPLYTANAMDPPNADQVFPVTIPTAEMERREKLLQALVSDCSHVAVVEQTGQVPACDQRH